VTLDGYASTDPDAVQPQLRYVWSADGASCYGLAQFASSDPFLPRSCGSKEGLAWAIVSFTSLATNQSLGNVKAIALARYPG